MTREQILEAYAQAELRLAEAEAALQQGAPAHRFGKGFERRMDRVCRRMEQGKRPTVSKAVKVLLVAALIAVVLAVSTFAVTQFSYRLRHLYGYSQLVSKNRIKVSAVDDVRVEYIPDGYHLTMSYTEKLIAEATYENDAGKTIQFVKMISEGGFLDNERQQLTEVRRNGTLYIIFREGDYCGVTWMDARYEYKFICLAYFSDEELFRIADGFH